MTSARSDPGSSTGPESLPLADPIAETQRLVDAARADGLLVRAIGGVAVHMRSPDGRPLLDRPLKDIDLVVGRGEGKRVGRLLEEQAYVGEEMFNALRGSRRQLFQDPVNRRQLDVFVGEFAMCHAVPVAERLQAHPYTVPLAELMLTKLQIVELNERDERDIYTLCYHHGLDEPGLEADVIAAICADDWGLWRTSRGTIERCRADLDQYELDSGARETIDSRLVSLWERIDAIPKTRRWKRRSRLGEHVRWYQEPEEV